MRRRVGVELAISTGRYSRARMDRTKASIDDAKVLYSNGYTAKQIADSLGVCLNTAKAYIRRIENASSS